MKKLIKGVETELKEIPIASLGISLYTTTSEEKKSQEEEEIDAIGVEYRKELVSFGGD